jgi:Holliday junction DNA helicase RuvA
VIAQVTGRLVAKSVDRAEVMTASGIAYEIAIPLSAFESLQAVGAEVLLHTHLVVKEDGWQLFGFATPHDRQVFRAVLTAKGVGPSLALSLLSALSAERLVRAIRDRDIALLQTVPRVGRKKADQLVLDLADKMDDLYEAGETHAPGVQSAPGLDEAVRGLVRLGYARADAERAVRATLDGAAGPRPVADLVRAALARLASK